MNKIIVCACLMLISSVAWGQKHLPHDGNFLPILDDDGKSVWCLILSDEVYFKHDTIFAKKPNVLGASDCISSLNLLSLWDAYRQECWNDSSEGYGYWIPDTSMERIYANSLDATTTKSALDNQGNRLFWGGRHIKTWQHSHAPNATEFIDVYLRKRLK